MAHKTYEMVQAGVVVEAVKTSPEKLKVSDYFGRHLLVNVKQLILFATITLIIDAIISGRGVICLTMIGVTGENLYLLMSRVLT